MRPASRDNEVAERTAIKREQAVCRGIEVRSLGRGRANGRYGRSLQRLVSQARGIEVAASWYGQRASARKIWIPVPKRKMKAGVFRRRSICASCYRRSGFVANDSLAPKLGQK